MAPCCCPAGRTAVARPRASREHSTLYATSPDGLAWTKPALGNVCYTMGVDGLARKPLQVRSLGSATCIVLESRWQWSSGHGRHELAASSTLLLLLLLALLLRRGQHIFAAATTSQRCRKRSGTCGQN